MKPILFEIGPVTVYGYGLMIALGIIIGLFIASRRAEKAGLIGDVVFDMILYGVIVGFIGAKFTFILTELRDFLKDPLALLGSTGFVVYGGIIVGALTAYLYCRKNGHDFLRYFDIISPSIALAQGFGRIGCFLAGCCYGKKTDSCLGVVFPSNTLGHSNVKVLPTQLFSSVGDFIIFTALLLYGRKKRAKGNVSGLYMVLYGVGRFLIEFLRDDERGAFWIFSTSQWISLFIVPFGILMMVISCKRAKAQPETEDEAGEAAEAPEEPEEIPEEPADTAETVNTEAGEDTEISE